MGKWCLHASLFLDNKDMFKNYKRFDFWHVQTAYIGGTKPCKNNCSLIWKLFKFLMTLLAGLFEMRGCWHIGLRWAIVALWATCLNKILPWHIWLRWAIVALLATCFLKFFNHYKNWDGLSVFTQETIYHVCTEMRQSLKTSIRVLLFVINISFHFLSILKVAFRS